MKTLFANLASATLAAFFSTAGLHAQQPIPSPDQAPLLFRMLDQNGDKQVNRDEARIDLKENFALVDSNGDGEIDWKNSLEF